VKIFGHGDGHTEVEGVGDFSDAVEEDVSGDGSVGDADGGAGGAGEEDGRGDVADRGVQRGWSGAEIGSADFYFSSGHGCGGSEAVEVGFSGGGSEFFCMAVLLRLLGFLGFEEREERVHDVLRVERREWECNCKCNSRSSACGEGRQFLLVRIS
jgi:hypothetical protein